MQTAKLAVEFFPKFYLFCECNSVRVSQNIPKRGIAGKIYLSNLLTSTES